VTTWYGFADAIFKQARVNNLPLKLGKLGGISTAEFPTPAARPSNSKLNVSKIENVLDITRPNWQQQLEYTINSYLK
jgi:dTDP-4-dehydrorhamnose reductase